ncbi:YagK/YfjJ domain-containing protein [Aeromonas taiwanensis]|uniref:YagK/YfjJ domain-containing protein n=1 Tax=Aeromonas taiwanensis TaxID=633417 RepID=UPI00248E644F|nr:inovirus-type Gp2 protein [Aeromonas taiwanensis]
MTVIENSSREYLTPNFEYGGYYWPVIGRYQVRKDIMHGIFKLLGQFYEKSSKLIAIRLELKMKLWSQDNQHVGHFFKQLKRKLFKHYGHCYYGYIWVREQNHATAQHYHTALFVDGHKVRHSNTIRQLAECIWQHGYLSLPKCPFYRVHRNQIQRFQALIYRLSYLAKAETKGNRPSAVKDYQTSRSIRKL